MTDPSSYPPAAPPNTAPDLAPMPRPVLPPPRKVPVWRRFLLVFGLIILVLIGVSIWKKVSGNPDEAKVGNCLTGQTADDLLVVKCTDKDAQWTVVGKLTDEDRPASGTMVSHCGRWPTTEYAFWKGRSGGSGYILCLAPKN
jgi:hypothetical protein